VAIKGERVLLKPESALLRNLVLPLLDGLIKELLDAPAVQTDQVVMMAALIEFEDRLSRFKIGPQQNASLLKLGEHPIDRGKANIEPVGEQQLIDIFCAEVPHLGLLKKRQHFEPRHGDLESRALDIRREGVVNLHATIIAV